MLFLTRSTLELRERYIRLAVNRLHHYGATLTGNGHIAILLRNVATAHEAAAVVLKAQAVSWPLFCEDCGAAAAAAAPDSTVVCITCLPNHRTSGRTAHVTRAVRLKSH